LKIRRAEEKDLEKLLSITDTSYADDLGFLPTKLLEDKIQNKQVLLALKDDGEILGFAIAGKTTLWNLFVKPEARGEGVGSQLLERIDPTFVRVKKNPKKSENPIPFYKSKGFRVVKEDTGRRAHTENGFKMKTGKTIVVMINEEYPPLTNFLQ